MIRQAFVYWLLIAVLSAINSKTFAQPLPSNSVHTIVVQMSDSPEELWMLNLLVSSPGVNVKSVLLSSTDSTDGLKNVKTLLQTLGYGGIPVISIVGENSCSMISRIVHEQSSLDERSGKPVLLVTSAENEFLKCLPDNTVLGKDLQKVIICTGDSIQRFSSLKGLRLDIFEKAVSIPDFDNDICDTLEVLQNGYNVIVKIAGRRPGFSGPVLVALYLANADIFDMQPVAGNTAVRICRGFSVNQVKNVVQDMMKGRYHVRTGVVFSHFPMDVDYYAYDVREIMDSTISRFGPEEWKACVLTDELHGHLGVFSIVGAKMGILAMEYFGTGRDELEITSYAGSHPPYSCLNDGLQASTGATLGMGTISLDAGNPGKHSAVFSYRGKPVMITLKDQYLEQVEADIREGIVQYGLMDDGYWKLVRRSALKYWSEWDRNQIFSIEPLERQIFPGGKKGQ